MRAADLEHFDRRSVVWSLRLLGAALVTNVVTEARAGVLGVHAGTLYPWRHLPILPLYPPWALVLEWGLTVLAGLALLGDRQTRVALRTGAAVSLVAVIERFSNHGALLFLVCFFFALDPPDLAVASPAFEARERPGLGLVRAQLVLVYAFSALNKLTHGFTSGRSLENLLGLDPSPARVLAWAVVAAEIALPLALVVRPRLGIAGVVALHAAFAVSLAGLGSFGLTMTAMAVLFLPPSR